MYSLSHKKIMLILLWYTVSMSKPLHSLIKSITQLIFVLVDENADSTKVYFGDNHKPASACLRAP
jgi:hypothetical protein